MRVPARENPQLQTRRRGEHSSLISEPGFGTLSDLTRLADDVSGLKGNADSLAVRRDVYV
jgi:hypothetical protein